MKIDCFVRSAPKQIRHCIHRASLPALALTMFVVAACTATAPKSETPKTERREVAAAKAATHAPVVHLLANASFEAPHPASLRCPPDWYCTMHADPKSFAFDSDGSVATDGKHSLRIERVKPEPWGLIFQMVPVANLRGKRVVLSGMVRVEGAEGAGGGLYVDIEGPVGLALHEQRLAKGTHDWQRTSIEFVVPPDAVRIRIGAIQEGQGRTWIDELLLQTPDMR